METEKNRCSWCLGFDDYIRYHDEEWGVPVYSDRVHFEFLVLESDQAGLSWATVLKKKQRNSNVFADFDYEVEVGFLDSYMQILMLDAGIIRIVHKIKAAINNAHRFMEVQAEFESFSSYIWAFVGVK